jgi:chitinase
VGLDGMLRTLGVTAAANGTRPQLSACDAAAAQTWQARTNGQLVNPATGKCLDATSANLAPLRIWDCWGQPTSYGPLP